jgi:16S rRNA (uracil1498-N3)-methyltransferase
MHRFYAPAAADASSSVELPAEEARHASTVLRLSPGDTVMIFDGRGREWVGELADVARDRATVQNLQSWQARIEPPVRVTIAIGLLKGDQMDAVVRDATVLGAAVIAPFVSAHTAVPEEARQTRAVERWCRVAIAAAKQSGRAVLPSIRPVVRLHERLEAPDDNLLLVCVEPALATGTPLSAAGRPTAAQVFIGPEGGWSTDELDEFQRRGARLLSLGPRRLRAETVPNVALTTLWTIWGWT